VLGKTTDTLDITGNVTGEYEVNSTLSDVKAVLEKFRGVTNQVPPMYSAVSVDGKRLYDLARQGIEVERQARQIEIKKLELIENIGNEYTIDVVCTKGTYIRSLIDDIGKELGCGATMTKLTRTLAMGFTLDDCVTLSELQDRKDNCLGFDDVLIDIEKMFEPYDDVYVSEAQAKRFSNGGALSLERIKKQLKNGLYRVYSPNGLFLGLGEADLEKAELSVKRLLVRRD
jgi:tRNA pseudouridine55 synthase